MWPRAINRHTAAMAMMSDFNLRTPDVDGCVVQTRGRLAGASLLDGFN